MPAINLFKAKRAMCFIVRPHPISSGLWILWNDRAVCEILLFRRHRHALRGLLDERSNSLWLRHVHSVAPLDLDHR